MQLKMQETFRGLSANGCHFMKQTVRFDPKIPTYMYIELVPKTMDLETAFKLQKIIEYSILRMIICIISNSSLSTWSHIDSFPNAGCH